MLLRDLTSHGPPSCPLPPLPPGLE
jgi:hypothetical protein